jgi:hypothetical protein
MGWVRGSRFAVTVVAALVCVAFAVGFASRSGQRQIRLRAGDSVSIPSLGWTCLASTFQGRPIFTCTSDDKAAREDTIWRHQIIVGKSGRPVPVHGGYRFRF